MRMTLILDMWLATLFAVLLSDSSASTELHAAAKTADIVDPKHYSSYSKMLIPCLYTVHKFKHIISLGKAPKTHPQMCLIECIYRQHGYVNGQGVFLFYKFKMDMENKNLYDSKSRNEILSMMGVCFSPNYPKDYDKCAVFGRFINCMVDESKRRNVTRYSILF